MDTTCVNGILLTYPPHVLVANAAQPPKHSGRHVSLAQMVQSGPRGSCLGPPLGDFCPPRRSARMCVDKHKNFIDLKDVPAPIAIFRTQRH